LRVMREFEVILGGLILRLWTTLVDHAAGWRTAWGLLRPFGGLVGHLLASLGWNAQLADIGP